MVTEHKLRVSKTTQGFFVRKLTRSGNSRSISVGTILPLDWVAVKLTVLKIDKGVREIRLEQIK